MVAFIAALPQQVLASLLLKAAAVWAKNPVFICLVAE